MKAQVGKIYVIGHKNPDTDSICSAIAYAELKRMITGNDYTARRAGQINEETQYVLDRFGIEAPTLLTDVKLQVKDLDIHKFKGVSPNESTKETWKKMRDGEHKTMPVLTEGELVGVVSTGDIVKSYMDVYDSRILSKAKTQYKSIVETIDGKLITGNCHGYFSKGKVAVAASNSSLMTEFIEKDDLVIVSNRYEAQECAIDINAGCIVICNEAKISQELVKKAKEQSITIISSPYDTFTVSRLINQSIPIKHFMTKKDILTFEMTDYVDDIKEEMSKKKFRDFPIVDRDGQFQGFISRRRIMNATKKRVILIDHNEKSQAIDGIEEAEILEIIDHHRLGIMETTGPIFFRNQPVGCTATIISQMYEEEGVKMSPEIAGILCAAIISDTLMFRSPTCTALDKHEAKKLAEISGTDIEILAQEMFKAGSNLSCKNAEEICFQDFKQFTVNDIKFGIGQINFMNKEELEEIKEKLVSYLPQVLKQKDLQMVYFMLTDIIDVNTEIIFSGENAKKYITDAYDLQNNIEKIVLQGVVSRKKQLVPALVSILQQ